MTKRGGGGKREWVREKAGHGEKGKERETSSRTDNFYFGRVANSAWLSDKSKTQWRCASGRGVLRPWMPYLEKGSTLQTARGEGQKGEGERAKEEKGCDAGPSTVGPHP